jgi:hypothetical protein
MDDSAQTAATVLGLLLLLLIAACIYLIPTIVAFKREHPNRFLILILNVLVGSTVIGWIIALVWATRTAHISPNGSESRNGGESGLNIFGNDESKVRVVSDRSPIQDLERLAELRRQGLLTEDEFALQKQRLLSKLSGPATG